MAQYRLDMQFVVLCIYIYVQSLKDVSRVSVNLMNSCPSMSRALLYMYIEIENKQRI